MTINACMVALHGAVATLLLTVYCPDVCAQVAVEESAEIRREQRSLDYAVQIYALRSGDTIKHHQYDGLIRRLDADQREVARARVPKADAIAKGTTIVVSANQLRLLVIHEDDQSHFPARHKVAFLDVASLKTLAEPPLGECRDPRGPLPIMAAQLTLTCFHSRPPDEQKRRPTFALVTLNLNRGELVRWFPLGGERNGAWFGPMFFGYRYDVSTVPVEQSPKPCPFDVTLPALDPTAERREHPALVLVLERRKGEAKGEVWFVGADTTVPPRRVAQLEETPRSAVGCEIDGRKLLYVKEQRAPAERGWNESFAPRLAEEMFEVFDLSTGIRIAR